ncbi:MAG: hypothetical protein ABI398_10030 [Devosia sp.]
MRNFTFPLLVVAVAGFTSAGFAAAAAPTTTAGTIKALDAKACTVTLDTTVYHFDPKCDFSKLTVGEKVSITWTAKDKADWASKIVAAS